MGERTSVRRRVLIEDARRNGHHLRATWHAETRQFVFSTWRDDVCTGATRVAVADVAELAGLLVEGLADSAGTSPAPPSPSPRPTLSTRASGLGDRARAWWRTFRGLAA
jgi:hypothetical protein